jgi:transcriptional regulator GlxA family with amidase domain
MIGMSTEIKKLKLGAVLFEEFELLDVFGPLEMFGLLRDRVEIVMLGQRAGAVRSNQGPRGWVDVVLAESPPVDVLLIPGGWGTRRGVEDPVLIQALKDHAESAAWVATVCTGTALLARTGLLDGRKATTNKLAFKWVMSQGPAVNWVPEARWVEDGKFFTASGVSAGMDMALGLIGKIFDRETALQVARWAEYTWNDDPTRDPFAKPAGLVD